MNKVKPILQVNCLCKQFGTVKAVDQVSINFYPGEFHTIIGENGSGKSTLAYMIAGVHAPTSGEMIFKGEKYAPRSIIDASQKGISMLVQEQRTIGELTIAENLFLGHELRSKRQMQIEARKILKLVNLENLEPDMLMRKVTFEDRKLIEVGMAVYLDPEILIFDETTTSLSLKSRNIVYGYFKTLCKKGKTIILISHILEEVKQFSDTVTVMRDGAYVGSLSQKENNISDDNIRRMMIGRDLSAHYYRDAKNSYCEEVVLKVEDICEGILSHVSLELKKGEILGLGGLTDCGMHELCKIIFGIERPAVGVVEVCDRGKKIHSAYDAVNSGMAYLSKNRDQESLILSASVKDNILVTAVKYANKAGFIAGRKVDGIVDDMIQKLQIKVSSDSQLCYELSGGNKQKVVVAKWLSSHADILIMDCPTRGIDIGIKAAIYRIMSDLVKEGKSIIMVSEEMPELIGMSDRIIIMKNGCISGEIQTAEDITEMDLINYMV